MMVKQIPYFGLYWIITNLLRSLIAGAKQLFRRWAVILWLIPDVITMLQRLAVENELNSRWLLGKLVFNWFTGFQVRLFCQKV